MFPDHLLDAHSAQDRKTRLSAIMTPVKEIFTGGCGFSKVLHWSYLSTMSFKQTDAHKKNGSQEETEKHGAK